MKKLFLVIVSLLLALSASAQFGIVGGITSSASHIKDVDVRNINLYHAGVAYKIPLILGFTFQPELLFNTKGNTIADLNLDGSPILSFDTKTSYIEFGAQMQLGANLEVARLYLLGEPFLGYAFKQSQNVNMVGDATEFMVAGRDYDWNGVNRLEYGFAAGIGIEVIDHVQIAVKYFWNLGPLYNNDGSIKSDIIETITKTVRDSKAGGIQISAALIF